MSTTVRLDWDEAKEIADFLTKTENPDEYYEITENAVAEKWSISMENFHEIADGIFRMIDFGISPLTQTPFVGISKENEWIAKKEVNLKGREWTNPQGELVIFNTIEGWKIEEVV